MYWNELAYFLKTKVCLVHLLKYSNAMYSKFLWFLNYISTNMCLFNFFPQFWYSICKHMHFAGIFISFKSCFIAQNWSCSIKVQYQTLVRNFWTFIDLLPNLYLNCNISETFFSVKNIDNTFIESALKKSNFGKSEYY